MKLFLDSAILNEVKEAYDSQVIDGLTTNPSLIKKAISSLDAETMNTYIQKILLVAKDTPVSLEVKGGTAQEMYSQAMSLLKHFSTPENRVVIKIPIDSGQPFESLKVIKNLSSEGIPVNVTLVFTPEQALLAAKAGATYVSPFVGRIDDLVRNYAQFEFQKNDFVPISGIQKDGFQIEDNGVTSGLHLVKQIVDIFREQQIHTEVLAASIRNTRQVRECALLGADIATIPFSVLQDLQKHNLTDKGMESFTNDLVSEYEELLQ